MTREAIEYFKFNRKIFCEDHLKICPKDSIAYQATLKEKEFYDMAIKALEQEPVLDTDIILSREEYGELVSNEYDNGYAKGYRDALENEEPVLDKIRAKIEKLRPNLRPEQMTDYDYAMVEVVDDIVAILDNYKADKEEE